MRTSRVVLGEQSKLSVIVPSWNLGCFLDDCLRSLLACTEHTPGVRPFSQIVVVDDCSTDNTAAVAKEYARAGVDYIRNPERKGICFNLNHYLPQLPTEWVCMVSADDWVSPRFATAHLDLIAKHEADPKFAIAYSGARYTVTHRPTERPELDGFVVGNDPWDARRLEGQNFIHGSAVLRREALVAVGGFPDVRVEEDHACWKRMSAAGYYGRPVGETLLFYRQHHLGHRNYGTDGKRAVA